MALTNLNLTTAADQACISMGAGLAKILGFAHTLNAEAARKGTVVRVPNYAAVAGEFASDNNYKQTTSVVGADVSLTLHPVAGFQASDVELAGSDVNYFIDAGKAAGQAVAKYLVEKFMKLVPATHSTSATVASTKAGLTGLVKTALENDIDPSNSELVLNPDLYAAMLNYIGDAAVIGTDAMRTGIFHGGALGFADVIAYPKLNTNVVGFIAEKGAMGFAARGVAVPLEGVYAEAGTSQDPGTGAPITLLRYGDPDNGTYQVTATCQAGVGILDAAHIVKLAAA